MRRRRFGATLRIRIHGARISSSGFGFVPLLFGTSVRVQFGDCTLDSDTRELSRGGEPVHLEPKAYRLLELLLAARPKALSKRDLQEELWPKTYVSERSLARLVADLRIAIGDRASEPQFIRTVHGFGYAFSGEVAADRRPLKRSTDFHCRLSWGDREIALVEGENVLGRDPDVAVWIDLNSVSRHHARVVVTDQSAILEDLGSRNGTLVNGEPVTFPGRLSNGDRIKIGAASLVFRCSRRLGTTESEMRP
jgi:DNA-binding winged helix-turn-helix (wHTH) protein